MHDFLLATGMPDDLIHKKHLFVQKWIIPRWEEKRTVCGKNTRKTRRKVKRDEAGVEEGDWKVTKREVSGQGRKNIYIYP